MVGDLDRGMIGVGRERAGQPVLLARREAFAPRAEEVADPVERVALAASVAEGLLLDSSSREVGGREGRRTSCP